MKADTRHRPPNVSLNARVLELTAELAQANDLLRKGDLPTAGIVHSAMDAIISVDSGQKIVLFNTAAEKMFLCPAAEALGHPIETFIPKRFLDPLRELIDEGGETELTLRPRQAPGVFRGLRADGGEFPLEASISEAEVAGKKIYTAILRDITGRHEIEEKLRATHEDMRNLIHNIPAVTYRLEADRESFHPSFVSDNITPFLGFTPEEATTSDWWLTNLHPEDCDAVRTTVMKFRTEGDYTLEYRIRHKDGSYRWVRDDHRALRDAAGEWREGVGVWTDISLQKRTEEALQARLETQERLAKITETLPGVVFAFRQKPDGSMSFPYASPQVGEYFGFEPAELAEDAAPVFAIMHPADRDRVRDSIAASARTLSRWQDEMRLQHPRKGEIWIMANSIPQREGDGGTLWHGFTMEITDRKRADDDLRASEHRFHSLFEHMLDGYAYCRMFYANDKPDDFVYLEVNSAFETLTGKKHAAGKKVSELIPGFKQTNPGLLETYGRVASTGRPERFETYVSSMGIWFSVSVYCPAKDHFVAVFDNITLRRQAEEALVTERTLLRTLFNLLPDDIYVKDAQSKFIACNNAVALRFGVASPQELIGKSDADFFPGAAADGFRAEELAVLGGTAMIDKEVSFVRPDGSRGFSLTTKMPLKDSSGKIVGLVGSGRDISKRKQAEEELRLFRALVDQSDDAFEVIDLESARFLDVNETGCRALGYSRAEYLALRLFDIDPTLDERNWETLVAGVKAAGSINGEGVHRRKDGTTFPVEFNSKWVRLDRDYLIAVVRDITERKKLEAQFLRMQRLEAIGTLASGIAHDLNNILAPMLMAAGLLKGKLTEQRDRDILSMVEHSAQRGANIIGQLLTFSRGIEGARVSVQTRHLLKEMVNIMRETFPRNLEIIQSVPNDLWTVVADATQLHQVLMNLCVNARDAMPDGGKLSLAAKNVRLDDATAKICSLKEAGPYLVLSVSDTGHGIPPGIIARIFDPFFTTKAQGKGTGLGLSTVFGIAKSHGGSVTVSSEPGRHTVFKVYLPATGDAMEPDRAGTAPPMAVGQGELVLVVDDEAPIRETTGRVLREHGYRVLTAANGKEAVELFVMHVGAVRLVLTDVMMPGMGAVELVRALRVLEPEINIIATSGLGEDEQRDELAAMGICTMLPKPCPAALLLNTVDRVLAAKR